MIQDRKVPYKANTAWSFKSAKRWCEDNEVPPPLKEHGVKAFKPQ